MSIQGIHPVSSKEFMLKPEDIFVVAAHEYKDGIKEVQAKAKKHGISAERMSYAIMVSQYSEKSLIRIREGNTLFTILALPNRVGLVRGYNGDTAENYIQNMIIFFEAARNLGFDTLFAHTTVDVVRSLKIALRKLKIEGIKSHFDSSKNIFSISMGEPRGE